MVNVNRPLVEKRMRTKTEIITEFKKAKIRCPDCSFDAAHEALQHRQNLMMEMLQVLSKEISDVSKIVVMWASI